MSLLSTLTNALRSFAGLPLTMVATHSLLAGLVLSSTEAAGWNDWGHEGAAVSHIPDLRAADSPVGHEWALGGPE